MLVEAFDRLGARVLGRLRDLREDLDADLADVRSQVAALTGAVEDVADRVELRQLRGAVDELRSDVAGLRRTIAEPSGREHAAAPELEDLAQELSELRAEMVSLRRRMSLKASGSGTLTPEELAAIAEVVTERLLQAIRPA